MTTTTPNQGLVLPEDSDINNVPSHMDAYNDGVENRLVQRYASAVDRSVRNPSPIKGEVSYLTDEDLHERWDGTGWKNFRGGIDHFYLPGESNTVLVSFSSLSFHTIDLSFAVPFSVPPLVFTNIATSAGVAASWISRAYNISTTGFTLYLDAVDNTTTSWGNVPVNWVAIGQQ